ncbi:MFS general substrate transporter [Athelia psychrophila]|uniref:MFS general substrate transporter n=1 Tax=Athelia psychrophila TaxID=1759441 RepID=A0A166QV76_9AGAM|nr:MFS general substrate transporter [Fibularhizoctonia sp. CBS 109695]
MSASPEPPVRSFLNVCGIILTCTTAMIINHCRLHRPPLHWPRSRNRRVHLEWVVSSFSLSSGCFLLVCGRLADLYGRKLTFVLGTMWLLVFSIACGFAQTGVQLNILRGVQGIGSCASMSAAIGILASAFPVSRMRSFAFATFSAGAPLGAGFGWVLGGVIDELSAAKWRGNFFLLAGFCALNVILALCFVDKDVREADVDRRVGWVGAALVTVGCVFITFALGEGSVADKGWGTPYIIVLLILGILFLAGFVWFQHYLVSGPPPSPSSPLNNTANENKNLGRRPPLMRLSLWTRAHGKVAAMQLIAFFNWAAFISWSIWAQLYYQTYEGLSPLQTMVRLLPMTIMGLLLNFVIGFAVERVDVLWLLVAGTTFTGSACLLFALIQPQASYWAFGFPAAILSVWGSDFIFSCGTLFVARSALPHEQSVAGGMFITVTQIGTALGLSVTTTIKNEVIQSRAKAYGESVADARGRASLDGFRGAQWGSFAFSMAALLLSVVFMRGVGIIGGEASKEDGEAEGSRVRQAPEEKGAGV